MHERHLVRPEGGSRWGQGWCIPAGEHRRRAGQDHLAASPQVRHLGRRHAADEDYECFGGHDRSAGVRDDAGPDRAAADVRELSGGPHDSPVEIRRTLTNPRTQDNLKGSWHERSYRKTSDLTRPPAFQPRTGIDRTWKLITLPRGTSGSTGTRRTSGLQPNRIPRTTVTRTRGGKQQKRELHARISQVGQICRSSDLATLINNLAIIGPGCSRESSGHVALSSDRVMICPSPPGGPGCRSRQWVVGPILPACKPRGKNKART